jgi:hypothetical protein
MNINVSIERLILDGLPLTHSQRPLLQAAVEAELARLLAAGGLATTLQAGGAVPTIPVGSIQVQNDSNPNTLGQQIARTVYGGIGEKRQ